MKEAGVQRMILGCLILVLIVVASSEKAEAVAKLNEGSDDTW